MNLIKKLSLCFGLWVIAQLANATDLRGRVDGTHNYSPVPFPMAGVQVTIFVTQQNPAGGVNYIPQATTVTGADGMYYFRDIPAGNFVLQIGGTNYPLQVLPQPAQDIQAVLLHF
jgi:hypothetical protein